MENVADIYALSPMQELMLLHALTAERDNDVLFNQIVYRLEGALDEASWRRAWQHLVDRHPALRTIFVWQQSKDPVQVVRAQAALPWTMHDWRDAPPHVQERRLDELLADDRAEGFDLMRPPLLRLILIRLAENRYWLMWSSHHLINDRWCIGLILEELARAYGAFVTGEMPLLPPAPRYRDYVGWLAAQDEAAARIFWRDTLRDLRARPLPFAPPSDAAPGHETVRQTLSAQETAVLRRFAQEHDLTIGALVPAAWGVVLAATTEADDVLFGLTVSGRPAELPNVTNMVGSFINNVPLRLQVPDTGTVTDWLGAVQQAQLALQPFEYTSPAQIQEWAGARPGRPLFDTLVVVQAPVHQSAPAGLEMQYVRGGLQTGYPISVAAAPEGDDLALALTFERRRVPAGAAQEMAAALRRVLVTLPQRASPVALRAAAQVAVGQRIGEGRETAVAAPSPQIQLEPGSSLETRLLDLWQSMLGRNGFGVDDDFFDLGGTSLQAMQLVTQIEHDFGAKLPLTAFLHEATISHLAAEIGNHVDARAWPLVVDIQPQGEKPPFFCVHGLTGDVLWFRELGACMAPDRPFFGLQAQGLDGREPGVDDIGEMAALYIDAIRTRQPSGPYFLGGASFGGTVALEMAQQLRAQGETVALLAMFDHVPTAEAAAGSGGSFPYLAWSWLRNAPYWFGSFVELGPDRILLRVRRKVRLALKSVAQKVTGPASDEVASTDVIDYAGMLPSHRQRLIEAHSRAISAYRPRPYGGRVVRFKARAQPLFHRLDGERAWRSFARGEQEVVVVPGSHEGMFMQPRVQTLAAALRRQLQIARG